jgi:hypothetical protein
MCGLINLIASNKMLPMILFGVPERIGAGGKYPKTLVGGIAHSQVWRRFGM